MKCPHCEHVTETALLRCKECGQTYDRHSLEHLQNTDFLLKWINAKEEVLGQTLAQTLRQEVQVDIHLLREKLLPPRALLTHEVVPAPLAPERAPAPTLQKETATHLAGVMAVREALTEWVALKLIPAEVSGLLEEALQAQINAATGAETPLNAQTLPTLSQQEFQLKALALLEEWTRDLLLSETHAGFLREHLEAQQTPHTETAATVVPRIPTPVSAPQQTIPWRGDPTPVPAPPPPPPAKPKEPLIQWDKVWGKIVDAAVSGLLLRWLRYLGAFLFVVSLAIVVVSFWKNIPTWGQIGIIFFIPTAFYGGGWFVRKKLQIEQTGGVLMGVGALLLAVDFAAIYQFGGLRVPLPTYWFIISLICTLVYLFTSWRILRTEFFGYITLLGVNSTLLATVNLIGLPLEWGFVSLIGLAIPIIGLAQTLAREDTYSELGVAFRRLPQIVMPVLLTLLFFVPGNNVAVVQTVAFALASVAYGMLAWQFDLPLYAHVTSWGVVATVGIALRMLNVAWVWGPSVGAGLALVYAGVHLALKRKSPEAEGARLAFQTVCSGIGHILLLGGGLLGSLGVVFFDISAGIIAGFLVAGVLGGYAYLYRNPRYSLAAPLWAFFPFSAWVANSLYLSEIAHPLDWLGASWAGLALCYLGGLLLLRKHPTYGKGLGLGALLVVSLAPLTTLFSAVWVRDWQAGPPLVSLGGALLVYTLFALLHDTGQFPALSEWVNFLPESIRKAVFLWVIGGLIPGWGAVAWAGSVIPFEWFGLALVGMALAYTGVGQGLFRRDKTYRLPFHVYAFGLIGVGIWVAWGAVYALMATLYLSIGAFLWLAVIYQSTLLVAVICVLFVWPFQLSLNQSLLTPHAHALAYAFLAGLGYVPVGAWLREKRGWKAAEAQARFAPQWPVLVMGFLLSGYAIARSVMGRFGGYPLDVPWIGWVVPLGMAGLYAFSGYWFRQNGFGWAVVGAFSLAYWQGMTLFRILPAYEMVGWVVLGVGYLVLGQGVRRFFWALNVGAWGGIGLGMFLALPLTWEAFFVGMYRLTAPTVLLPPMLVYALAVGFVVLAAVLYRSRWPLFLEPWLVFVPVTLLFIGFGEQMFGQPLPRAQFGIIWAGVGLLHVVIAAVLEQRLRGAPPHNSQMQGVYLGGYALGILAVGWSVRDSASFLWAMGLWLVSMVGSAGLVHFKRHVAWENVLVGLFDERDISLRKLVRDVFLWVAAWLFPIWMTVLLWQVRVVVSFGYLGYVGAALAYIGLALWLRKWDRAYAWPLIGAGQFFTALALWMTLDASGFVFLGRMILMVNEVGQALFGTSSLVEKVSSPTAGFLLVQVAAILYYGLSSWYFQSGKWVARFYSYAASGLAFVAYTLGWSIFRPYGVTLEFVYFWLGLAAGLLGVGYFLDWVERRGGDGTRRVGFAHGPYVVGYGLLIYTLIWSGLDRWANMMVLGGMIVLIMLSHLAVHYERHTSYTDFLNFFWAKGETVARRTARTGFLFFAVYGFPVWLAQVLTYYEVPLAWRGLALALIAPVYIAFALAVRRVRGEYTWPLYSAGYALTAIGAMVALDDPLLAIYVLTINALVYAVSAYLFRQAGWLYLTTVLIPIIGLMTLAYNLNALPAPWVAGWLMGLAFLYFGVGQAFDRVGARKQRQEGISPFAMPFYFPGYVLSAIALAVASGERGLAIVIYLAGVVLYALSAWVFGEAVFLYPAVWLVAVPYYLVMTFTRLEPAWYGIGWLPLILAAIGIGRFVFHRKPFTLSFTHPAIPFYTLAYALSVSMMLIARGDFTALTVAFGAAAVLYFGSAGLFRRAEWLYPGVLAGHLALMTYFAIDPSGLPVRYISLAFLPVTWGMAWVGSGLSKRGLRAWGMPFVVFAVLDVVIWQGVGLFGWETGIITATSHALLLGGLAMVWLSEPLVWGSLGFLLLGLGLRLGWMGLPLPTFATTMAGIGLGLYLTGRVAEVLGGRLRAGDVPPLKWAARLALWGPLTRVGVGLNTLGAVIPLFFIRSHTTEAAGGLAFAGALYLAFAYRGHYYRLGYVAVAMLELAFVLLLRQWDIQQPQWYALPAGLYLVGMGVFERQRERGKYAALIEAFGLAVMLVTSFIQSLAVDNGFWYFLLLLGEGLAFMAWGAQQRRKLPFLIGLTASGVNVAGQVVVLFMGGSSVIRWVIFGGVGLLLLMAALFAERWLIPRAQELRGRLEEWA